MTTIIGIISALGLWACGGEQVPSKYHWDHNPQVVVASYGTAGSFIPQMMRFRQSVYGSPFVRLMGDGTLYHGTPNEVFVRKLSAAEMQDLVAKLRPDLFGDYKEHYNVGIATDLPTTTIRVNVKEWGDHAVGIYGLTQPGSGAGGDPAPPASLLDAATALRQAGNGGAAYKPARLRLAALQIDLQHYTQVDPSKVQDWPLAGVELSKALIHDPPSGGLVLADQNQVDKVVALLSAQKDANFVDTSAVFRQGGLHFWVAYVVLTP